MASSRAVDLAAASAGFLSFWAEPHVATLTTVRPDGTPHVVPVNSTLDVSAGTARVLCSAGSHKARRVRAAGAAGARVALCQVDGRRWATVEGVAVVRDDPEFRADAEARAEARYGRPPRPNPNRVVIEITVTRALSNL
ncbi:MULTISPECIES: pyridoxamine 5'-phosphate oxidase family protein [unclassified Saccharopolyspora]|uniref:pyridoxamine 5'-phosphate oxidase family protein n=1 Tax=unclassified Saccharopolyspora TaxID=2646250 RepID=UPI001CD389AB|nr:MULTISPECIES: TIGR03618 family F420-dependent PPOX class oxidoreductase [unclassified Saccharopolyspora]MCA1188812.1 TIGR03618 family F420-dependent PPOX class oxidoreductase [Saccharopolyspora sp. 6T]MCA1196208.1 TIGR03618 family F420-dependent PPOX class oxidoreductase [Saccharopolyspora sp. 6V]MCA1229367.1 TIGR03618 family F420-dependent PPOX class oxidoreductase [Saccharopolyspora sp. 6M]MCA1283231.1 TIGR03618 family F420-dependent PPOX class oxidoreductase [Saccharopolyspora sp. 7B]